MAQPFVGAREAEHEPLLAESFAAAQASDEDDVSRDQGGGEEAITRGPAGGPRSWSAAMIADTVASESDADGWRGPDDTDGQPASGTAVSGTGWPVQASDSVRARGYREADQFATPAYREPEQFSTHEYRDAEQFWTPDDWSERQAAYRQLWGPPGRKLAPRQALGRPYVWDGSRPDEDDFERADDDGDRQAEPPAAIRPRHSADPLSGYAATTERAVIGDELRELAAWCQIGACIARYADPQALGEVDVRNRAVAAGWCVDLFGRLICPSCQQVIPVWSALPPVGRDRAARQPPMTAEAQFGRHRRMRWPTPRSADAVP